MARPNVTLYTHICTQCGQERRTANRLLASGLCRACWCTQDRSQQDLERFWSHVDTQSPCVCHDETDNCWIWMGYSCKRTGYGKFYSKRGLRSAHRFIYDAMYGPIPSTVHVLHRPPCALRRCVRHLYGGNARENARDRKDMGHFRPGPPVYGEEHAQRHQEYINNARGEKNGNAKLTTSKVLAIWNAYQQGAAIRALARQYEVSRIAIKGIVREETWRHVTSAMRTLQGSSPSTQLSFLG